MASFPGPKAHRVNRRKLGRNQRIQVPAAVISLSTATLTQSVLSISLSVPCCVTGIIPIAVQGITGVAGTQSVVNSTLVVQTFSSAFASTATASLAAAVPQITTFQGGTNAAYSGLA